MKVYRILIYDREKHICKYQLQTKHYIIHLVQLLYCKLKKLDYEVF